MNQIYQTALERDVWPQKTVDYCQTAIPQFQEQLGDRNCEYAVKDAMIAATHTALERRYRTRRTLVPMLCVGLHPGGSAAKMKRQSRNPKMPRQNQGTSGLSAFKLWVSVGWVEVTKPNDDNGSVGLR
jgi:hypothetical protein